MNKIFLLTFVTEEGSHTCGFCNQDHISARFAVFWRNAVSFNDHTEIRSARVFFNVGQPAQTHAVLPLLTQSTLRCLAKYFRAPV